MYIFSTSELVVAIANGCGARGAAVGFFGAGGCCDGCGCLVGVTGGCCVCVMAVIVGGGVSGLVTVSVDSTDSLRAGELLRAFAFS